MVSDILQILLLLGVAMLLVWLYFRQQLRTYIQQAEQANKGLDSTRSKYSYLVAQNSKYDVDRKEWLQQLHELENAKEQLENELVIGQKQLATSQAKVQLLETYKERSEQKDTRIKDLESERREAQNTLRRLQHDQTQLTNEQQQQQQIIHDCRLQIAQLNEALKQYRTAAHTAEQQRSDIDSLQQQLQKANEWKKQQLEQMKEKNVQIMSLEINANEADKYKNQYDDIKEKYQRTTTALASLQDDYQKLLDKNRYNELLLTELRQMNQQYQQTLHLMEQQKVN